MFSFASPPSGPTDETRGAGDPLGKWSAGTLLMTLLLASLGMLFGASIVAYLVIRLGKTNWPPPGAPDLPPLLWISTAIILISSATMHLGLSGAKRGVKGLARGGLAATAALGVAFLVCQLISWLPIMRYYGQSIEIKEPLFTGMFFFLTGLHGLHVIGGLIPAVWLTLAAFAGRLSPDRSEPVSWLTMYWHFLDVVWIVLFAVLWSTM